METKDNTTTIVISAILLFSFIVFLFYGSYKREEINLIREDLANDSLIMQEYNTIKVQDSISKINDFTIKKMIYNHERRLRNLEKKRDSAK